MAAAEEALRDAEARANAGEDDDNDAAQPASQADDADAGAEVAAAAAVADGEAAVKADDEDGGGGDELSFDYSGDEMEDADEANQVCFGGNALCMAEHVRRKIASAVPTVSQGTAMDVQPQRRFWLAACIERLDIEPCNGRVSSIQFNADDAPHQKMLQPAAAAAVLPQQRIIPQSVQNH